MKKNVSKKSIKLTKETLRSLHTGELEQAAGGRYDLSKASCLVLCGNG